MSAVWAWVWVRHCGRCNNPSGVFNPDCTGPHMLQVLRSSHQPLQDEVDQ